MKQNRKTMIKLIYICISGLFVFFMAGCGVTKPRKYPEITAETELFRDLPSGDSASIADLPWRSLFTDRHLQELIDEGLTSNADIQTAIARMKAAKANLRQSKAALLPSLGLNADATYQNENSDGSGLSENYQLYGSASWEVDIWGKLRKTKRAYLATFLESEAYKRTIQTELIADIAINYYILLAYDEMLSVTEKTVEKYEADVEAMELLKKNDVVTGADLVLSEANRYSAEVTIPDLKQSIYETENTLCLLLGRNPGSIVRSVLDKQSITANMKTGIPARLLANRPDVQEAEFAFRYYYEMTNVARSYFYPSLTITASGGITETDITKLFDASTIFWNIAGGLTQPLFNQGLNKQRLEVAEANEEEYFITFKQTLLTAGSEVVNAMHQYETASQKIEIRSKQIEYLEKSVDYTMELLKYTSSTNYTDVLTSEVNLLSAQLESINDKLEQLQAVVTLYKSLGGGWKE